MEKFSAILKTTLDELSILYTTHSLKPGIFVKAGLKQGWNVVIGTRGQCGMAMSFAGREDVFGRQEAVMQSTQEQQTIRPSNSWNPLGFSVKI
jgi:hypothetical protein